MADKLEFDVNAAHKYFSAQCFNRAWDLIDKTDRTPDEDEEMVRLNQASIWHWTQRDDCTAQNMSVGYWQASRVYALLRQSENARRYGRLCLEASHGEDVGTFFLGFAYEALARAESVAGDRAKMREYLDKAVAIVDALEDEEEKNMLTADLDTIK